MRVNVFIYLCIFYGPTELQYYYRHTSWPQGLLLNIILYDNLNNDITGKWKG